MQEGGENIMNHEESGYNAKNLNCKIISNFSFLISHYLFRLGTRPSTIADLAGA